MVPRDQEVQYFHLDGGDIEVRDVACQMLADMFPGCGSLSSIEDPEASQLDQSCAQTANVASQTVASWEMDSCSGDQPRTT